MTDPQQPDRGEPHGEYAVVVVDTYDDPQLPRLKLIRTEVARVATTFERLGFVKDGQDLAGDSRSGTIRGRFRTWRPETRWILLYWAGHGRPEGVDEYYLCCRDTKGHPGPGNAVSAIELGQWLADKDADAIVLVVESCHTGGGAREIFTAFDKRIEPRAYPPGHRPRLAVIGAAQRHQSAREALFARTLIEVLENGPPSANESYLPWGEHDAYLTPTELADAVAERLRRDGIDQCPECKGDVANFFPNRHHVAFAPHVEVEAKRRRGAWLPADVREHFLVKFRGIDTADERGWYFTGRTRPLAEIVDWLHTARSGLLVVTGPPGCGKSAILGRLAVLSDAAYRAEAQQAGVLAGLEEATDPGVGSIDVGVHAKNKTLLDCVGELAAALELAAPTGGWQGAGELVAAVADRGEMVTVLLDALDEARPGDLGAIAADLLRGLAALPGVRVVVGTRPDRAHPDQLTPTAGDARGPLLRALAADRIVRLDQDPDAEAAITTYVTQRLAEIPGSPYVNQPEQIRPAAAAVAAHSQGIFLFARLLARALAHGDQPLDSASAEAQQLLRGGVAEAFAADLARFGRNQQRVRDLLTPLAWAEGAGLPRRQVWLALADALADRTGQRYTEADLAWVLEHAGAHLIEAGEDGQTVYRLYHQAFNDYLRRDHDPVAINHTITDALLELIESDGRRDWASANPYLHRHLATHAAAAGRLGELVADARYLLYADPQQLARVLGSVDHTTHVLARLYWRALDRLRDAVTPAERAAVLHVTALDHEPAALPLLDTYPELPWRGVWAAGPPTPFHRRLTGSTRGGGYRRVHAVAVGQVDGRAVVVSGSADQTVRVWDAATGEPQATVPGHTLTGHTRTVSAVAIGEVGGRTVIVSGSADQTVRVWDAATGRRQATLPGHTHRVSAVAIGEVGGRTVIVSGSGDQTVRVWDATTGEPQATLPGHPIDDWVDAVAVGEVGGRAVVVSGSADGTVRVWDAATGEPQATLPGHTDWVGAVAMGQAAGRAVVVSGSGDETVRVWDAVTGAPLATLSHGGGVSAVAVGEVAGRTIIVSGSGKTVKVWDAATGEPQATLTGDTRTFDTELDWVSAVAVGRVAGREVIICGGPDETVRVWDAATGEPLATRPGDAEVHHEVAVGQVGGRAVVVSSGYLGRWGVLVEDAATGARLATLTGHHSEVSAVAVGQVGGRAVVVSGSHDQTVRVWDAATGAPLATLTGHTDWVGALAVGQVGGRAVVVSAGDFRTIDHRTVRVWDAATGTPLATLPGHSYPVTATAVGLADRRALIALGGGNRVRVVELLHLPG